MSDLGDYQTPPALAAAVVARLERLGTRWPRVLEPTCGRGSFLAALLASESPPREFLGVEIQAEHLDAARQIAHSAKTSLRVDLREASIFDLDLKNALDWRDKGPLLVIGNPPWVTNAALGTLDSGNRPARINREKLRGIDAMTGASNFDIAEAVWLKLLSELRDERPTIALLCKTSVAFKVLEHAARAELPVSAAFLVKIDARLWFNASVAACLLCLSLDAGAPVGFARIPSFPTLDAVVPDTILGVIRGRVVADLDAYTLFTDIDGTCPLVWRQGLKHDAAAVMELAVERDGGLVNGVGARVDVEPEYIFPLFKGTDLARADLLAAKRAVVVTQRVIGEDTTRLERAAPRLWAYLSAREDVFLRRKSSVYRGRPPFSIFGIGPYAFAPFKVAVSGLHKRPVFHAIGSAMLDDTCYFLPFSAPEPAALTAALLNDGPAAGLLAALTTAGAKRPVTKALLQRLDLHALFHRAERAALLARATRDVVRLTGREPNWPDRLESLLESESHISTV